MPIYQLSKDFIFPPVSEAEDGILAVGGDLQPERLLLAYQNGIFPWYSQGDPIIWWSPDPRFVLFPEKLHVSKSTRKVLRDGAFNVTYNCAFEEVINACKKSPRKGQEGTWITLEMKDAYIRLYRLGIAKSVEVWYHDDLVGGLYGVDLGPVFCGESMFSKVSNASKVGFVNFVRDFTDQGGKLIDCQVYTDHLAGMGAEEIPRSVFIHLLNTCKS